MALVPGLGFTKVRGIEARELCLNGSHDLRVGWAERANPHSEPFRAESEAFSSAPQRAQRVPKMASFSLASISLALKTWLKKGNQPLELIKLFLSRG